MDIEALRAFVAVVEHGGFRAAAAARFTSQPSLSRLVARLESDLGVRLIQRGPRGARLTSQGEIMINNARRVLAVIKEARAQVVEADTVTIRLGAAATAAGSFLAPFLSQWIPVHPELRIIMLEDGARGLRSRLERGECDLAIVAAPVPETFNHLPITTVLVQALLPRDHRLAGATGPLRVTELDGEPLLVNGRPFLSTELLLEASRRAGVEPHVVYESSVGQTLAALAEARLGIAVFGNSVDLRGFDLPRRLVHDANGQPLSFDLHIAWPRNERLAPVVDQFVRELSAHGSRRSARTTSGWSL